MEKTKKKKLFIRLFIVIVLGVFLWIGWNKFQEWMFFHPWNDWKAHQALKKLDEFEEITIQNNEVELSGWFWHLESEEKAPLVIFFTGNAQNSSNTMYAYYYNPQIKEMLEGYNLMIVDYPGYGFSKGKPSDESMFVASKYVYEYASHMDTVDTNHIIIMGYSIGTGVASYLASVCVANGLILVAPYDRALSLYNDVIDSFHGSVESIARYSFDSKTYAEDVKEDTLIITSKDDEVINYSHSLDLAGHFPHLKEVMLIEGVNHNSYFEQENVLNKIHAFLEEKDRT